MNIKIISGQSRRQEQYRKSIDFMQIDFFKKLYQKYREVFWYLVFGVLTTLVSILSFAFFIRIGIDTLIANIFSWILSVLFAFVTNRLWVFQSKTKGLPALLAQLLSFTGSRLGTLLMEEAILYIFVDLAAFSAMYVKVAAQILVIIFNYILSKWVVFKKK